MAAPKRRMSRSNTRHRRAQWKATAPDLVTVVVKGEKLLVPRRLVRAVHREAAQGQDLAKFRPGA